MEWVKTVRSGKSITFEKKEGKAVAFRTVRQVLVESRGKELPPMLRTALEANLS